MPSLSELEARYNAFHANEFHYLADHDKQSEAWQDEQADNGRA